MIQQMDSQNWLPLVRHAEPFPSNKKSLAFTERAFHDLTIPNKQVQH